MTLGQYPVDDWDTEMVADALTAPLAQDLRALAAAIPPDERFVRLLEGRLQREAEELVEMVPVPRSAVAYRPLLAFWVGIVCWVGVWEEHLPLRQRVAWGVAAVCLLFVVVGTLTPTVRADVGRQFQKSPG